MKKTIGQTIGVVRRDFSIKLTSGEAKTGRVFIDYTHASDAEIIDWASSNRVIRGQNSVWRGLTGEQFDKLVHEQTFQASTIGHKIENPEEQLRKMEAAVDNMDTASAAALLEKLQAKLDKK